MDDSGSSAHWARARKHLDSPWGCMLLSGVLFFGDSPDFMSLQGLGLGPNGPPAPAVRANVLWLWHVALTPFKGAGF